MDVWWYIIVLMCGGECIGYSIQKLLGILECIVKVYFNLGDLLLDCFVGSGTLGEVVVRND